MKNEKGVVMRLKSTQKGLKLTLAGKGLSVEMVKWYKSLHLSQISQGAFLKPWSANERE
jgi:hypothetical protein